jgi:hypothetical protein
MSLPMLAKVVSGGQTGADQAGLELGVTVGDGIRVLHLF